jgi:hypothetical protein
MHVSHNIALPAQGYLPRYAFNAAAQQSYSFDEVTPY